MFATIAMALALQAAPEPLEPDAKASIEAEVPKRAGENEAETEAIAPHEEGHDAQPASPPQFIIPRDTPVHLMVLNEVSTKDHGPGHRFRLRVNEPVVVDGREVIPTGATAWGELTDAEKSGNVGKRGKLAATLSHIEHDGREIPLEGGTTSDGKSGKGETILGVLAMGPLGLFAKGNNAKIKAGEMMTAFVSEDVVLDDVE